MEHLRQLQPAWTLVLNDLDLARAAVDALSATNVIIRVKSQDDPDENRLLRLSVDAFVAHWRRGCT